MQMKEIFENYIENAFDGRKQAEYKIKQFEFNYKKYFPINKNSKVLDIGIGRGEMLTCMKNWNYGSDYLGIDISPSTVEFCKTLGLNCELVEDTVEWLKQHENSFAVITLLDVLEHVPKGQVIDFLKAIRLALVKTGTLIIQVPNLQAPEGFLHQFNDFTHETGFVEHSLRQVLLTSGFNKYQFNGFEEFVSAGWKEKAKKFLRSIFWGYVKLTRAMNRNLNPKILNPVFYATATNE